jgi:hypothetical protein
MSAFPKITLFVLLSLLNFSTFAQKLSKADTEKPYAQYKYLLQLPNEEVYNLAKKKFDKPDAIGYNLPSILCTMILHLKIFPATKIYINWLFISTM